MQKADDGEILSAVRKLLLRSYPDVSSFLQNVLTNVNDLIGSDLAFIGLVEDEAADPCLVVRDKTGLLRGAETGDWKRPIHALKIGSDELSEEERSFAGYVAHLEKARRTGDVNRERFYRNSDESIRSELAAPILLETELLGVINLERRKHHFYTPQDKHLLELVAKLIARPLDALMMREGLRRPFMELLDRVKNAFDSVPPGVSLKESNVLDGVAKIVAEALRRRRCRISLSDTDFGTISGTYGAASSTESEINVPLLSRGREIGVLKLGLIRQDTRNPEVYFTEMEQRLLNAVQDEIAAAAELKRAEKKQSDLLATQSVKVSALSHVFAELDLEEVLKQAAIRIPELCDGIGCSIFLWDEKKKRFVLRATTELAPSLIGNAGYRRSERDGLTGWIGVHGKPLNLAARTEADLRKIAPDLNWSHRFNDPSQEERLLERPFIGVPIYKDGETIGIIRVCDRKNGRFTQNDEQMITLVASHIATAIAYSNRYASRVGLLQRVEGLLKMLTKAVPEVVGEEEMKEAILREALKDAAELLSADVLTLYEYLHEEATFITPPTILGKLLHREFMHTGIHKDDALWEVMRNSPRYWQDAGKNPKLLGSIPARDGLRERKRFVEREKIVSSAGIRLDFGGHTVGVLFVNFRAPQPFNAQEKEIIETFAAQIALSIEISRFSMRIMETAAREEAEYLGIELHNALQTLSGEVLTRASAAKDLLRKGDNNKAKEEIETLERAAQYCVEECQFIMHLQMNHYVDDHGLVGALAYLRDEVWSPSRIKIHLPGDEIDSPLSLKRHLYRIAEAALSNVIKHSKARNATVSLRKTARNITMVIEDDGIGFDVRHALETERHYGLKGIQRRVEKVLGGEFKVEPMKLRAQLPGSKLTVTIPRKAKSIYEKKFTAKA